MTHLNIRHLVSGGIITNYFCSSACRHCLYNCSPNWEKRYISRETAEQIMRAARLLGCRSVHIGGGEPMLRPEKLGTVLETAAHAGVSVEYVETNSSWFKDSQSAKELLAGLRRKGLNTLLVSISPFHNEHIPFFKVKGVIEAARSTGLGFFPWVNGFVSDLSRFDPQKAHAIEEFSDVFGRDYLLRVLERYWIHMGGRALKTYRPLIGRKTFQEVMDDATENCFGELSDTSHFHVDLFGNYIPGLCSGLSVSIDDLGSPLADRKYPIMATLCHHGIRGLVKKAVDDFGFSPRQTLYINKCDLCTEIRRFLIQNNYHGSKELNPREYYLRS